MLKWLVFALFFPFAALADTLPQPTSDTVNDFAGILTDETKDRLSGLLGDVRDETGVHVVLVTMDRRTDYGGAGQSIETYAKLLFNTWGIGDRTRNDGVMILVAKTDREMRIQLGAGFPNDWNGVAKGVVDQAFLPSFRSGNYPEGIETGVSATIDQIVRPFVAGKVAPRAISSTPDDSGNSANPLAILMIPLGFLAVIGLALRGLIGDFLMRFKTCPQCGQKALQRVRTVLQQPTTLSEGRGQTTTTCSNCDFHEENTYTISRKRERSSRRSGGGGRGFGGGRSSGGGASGRW